MNDEEVCPVCGQGRISKHYAEWILEIMRKGLDSIQAQVERDFVTWNKALSYCRSWFT